MNRSFVHTLIVMLLLVIAQVLICNHIMLFNMATAFVFIYVIVSLPMNLKTDVLLTWAFLAGLVVDIFSDTLGVNSLACTMLAMIKRPVLFAFIPRDDHTKNVVPSLQTLGFSVYAKYLVSMVTLYCAMVFTIEYFSFADIKQIVVMIAASSVFTTLVLMAVDCLIISKREKRL